MPTKMNKHLLLILLSISFLLAFSQCGNTVDEELKKTAEFANKRCPQAVDNFTRLDSVNAIPGETYRFNYTVSHLTIADAESVKNVLKPELIKNIQIDPSMKFFRENNVTLEYYYRDEVKSDLFNIIITPSEYK